MDQSVIIIPFCCRIESGDSEFTLEIDRKFRDDPNRLFQFSSITLSPEYFNQKAYALGMDSDKELATEVVNNFHFEVEYEKNVFDESPWSTGTGVTNMESVLRSLNSHFDQHKPGGCIFSTVVFDWLDVLALGTKKEDAYHREHAIEYYGEQYNETKHSNWLPLAYRNYTRLNNMQYPTKPEAMEEVRIRMTLPFNVTVTFSNKDLLEALGCKETQIPEKVKNQYQFKNTTNTFKQFIFLGKPKFDKFSTTTKIHAYPTSNFIASNVETLKTTVKNERLPDEMAKDYSNKFASIAFGLNLNLKLEHISAEKKFKFIYPTSPGIRLNIRVPTYVAHKLGFGHVDNIKSNMSSTPYPVDDFTGDALANAQILVNDTGMVVVSLNERGSQQIHQFASTFMAHLEAQSSGVMTTIPGLEMPKVPISQFKKEMNFSLARMNENNQPIPLGWKIGAIIRGVLLGKV